MCSQPQKQKPARSRRARRRHLHNGAPTHTPPPRAAYRYCRWLGSFSETIAAASNEKTRRLAIYL